MRPTRSLQIHDYISQNLLFSCRQSHSHASCSAGSFSDGNIFIFHRKIKLSICASFAAPLVVINGRIRRTASINEYGRREGRSGSDGTLYLSRHRRRWQHPKYLSILWVVNLLFFPLGFGREARLVWWIRVMWNIKLSCLPCRLIMRFKTDQRNWMTVWWKTKTIERAHFRIFIIKQPFAF